MPALVAAVGATLLLLLLPQPGSVTGAVVAVGALQLVLVLSWSLGLDFAGLIGTVLVGAGAAVAADVVVLRSGADSLGPLAAVVGLAVILSFVHQLSRRAPRSGVTESLAGNALLAVVVVAASTFLVLFQITDGPRLLDRSAAAIGAAVVVGHLVDLLLPYPAVTEGVPRGLLGFLAGTAAAMLAAIDRGSSGALVEQLGAVILGGVLGGLACLMAIGASYAAAERRGVAAAQAGIQGVLPIVAVAPVAYFVSILVGS